MKYAILLFCLAALAGCATPAREARNVVSVKPEVSKVATPVAETKKAVASAATYTKAASKSVKVGRAIAVTTTEADKLIAEFDVIEANLTTTQAELQKALGSISASETAIAVLQSQVDQQSAELISIAYERNQIATEKRKVELSAAAGRQRERTLWAALSISIVISGALGVGLYLAAKPKFL